MHLAYTIILSVLFLHPATSVAAEENSWGEFDFIIVGAGTSGSAVAAKLAAHKFEVLVLEAGSKPLILTQVPYFSVGPFRGEYDWGFVSAQQEHGFLKYEDQKAYLPFGKGLGGTSTINGLISTRGNGDDYDNWASMGNDGWAYKDILKHFKNLETFEGPMVKRDDMEYHNVGGPVFISQPPYKTDIAETFINACQRLGYAHVDYNGATQLGCANPYFTLHKGARWSTYEAYIKPLKNLTNLDIVTNAYVTQVKFDGKAKAVGVKFDREGKTWTAKANKEIILSAGTIKTPHILMLSGIGNVVELRKNGIAPLLNLPGVGQNLMDHVTVFGMTYNLPPNIGFSFMRDVTPETLELWERKRLGPLTVPYRSEGIGFFKIEGEKRIGVPDFELLLVQPPGSTLDLHKEASEAAFKSANATDDVLIVFPILLQPKSFGSVTLKSDYPYEQPNIQPNYLAHKEDVDTLLSAIKFTIKLMETEEFVKLGIKRMEKVLPGCETFLQDSDDYFICQIRYYTSSVYHLMGTSKMGPASDNFAVVCERLKVHGVKGLRIADASIIPSIITGHPMLPAIMIGEKAASMIIEDWSKQKSRNVEGEL